MFEDTKPEETPTKGKKGRLHTTNTNVDDTIHVFSRVHATLQDTVSVGRSVGWSVCRSHFAFFAFLSILKIE